MGALRTYMTSSMEKSMEITQYKVNAIVFTDGKFIPVKPVEILDDGASYRIGKTHVFEKSKIQSMMLEGYRLTMVMADQTIVLEVVPNSGDCREQSDIPAARYDVTEEWVKKHSEQFGEEPSFF